MISKGDKTVTMNKHSWFVRLSFTAYIISLLLLFFFSVEVAFLHVNVNNATLVATHGRSVMLNCIIKSSKQRSHDIEWRKDGLKLAESSSLLTITYSNASDTNNKYHCVSVSSSSRDVQCTAVYQCSASLTTVAGLPEIKDQGNSTVTVILSKTAVMIVFQKNECYK